MPPKSTRARRLTWLVGIIFAVLVLWYLKRQIQDPQFLAALRQVDRGLLLLSIGVATLTFPLRIPRWRQLLPEPDGRRLSGSSLWHAIAIGFTANTLIGRAGELVRAATIARLEKLSFATAFASLAVERAVDGLIVVGLLGVGLMFTDTTGLTIGSRPIGPLMTQAGVIALVVTLLAVAAAWQPAWTLARVRALLPKRPAAEKFLLFVSHVLTGLGALRDPARAIPVLGWTIVLWVTNALAFWIGCLAFGIHIPFTAAFILNGMVVVGLAASPTPGGVGGFETALIGTLAVFGVTQPDATAFAIAFHLTTAIPVLLMGLWSIRRVGGSLTVVPEVKDLEVAAP